MKKINFSVLAGFLKGKGFYAVLCACVAVVGAAGYVTYRQTAERLENQLEITRTTETSAYEWSYNDFTEANAPKDEVPKETEETEALPETQAESVVSPVTVPAAAEPFVYPLGNEIIVPFSGGELVKSKTLNCWKTHDGVDIKGEAGEQVKAITTGKVISVYEDALFGVCVIIDHGNGIEGHYYSLAKSVTVKPDQKVSAGTVIGAVGNTAECEIAEVSHFHFGVKQNGEWIDPIAFVRANM